MSHILIDAKTGSPVPLPYFTATHINLSSIPSVNAATTVYDFVSPTEDKPEGRLIVKLCGHQLRIVPTLCGLAIITEEEFMARQEPIND